MYMDMYSNVVYVLLAGGVVILGYLFFRKRSRKMNTEG
jgi:LPXTG-motif cell wall-anchored protein